MNVGSVDVDMKHICVYFRKRLGSWVLPTIKQPIRSDASNLLSSETHKCYSCLLYFCAVAKTTIFFSTGFRLINIILSPFQHEKEYKEILDAVKGSDKEKQLAAQFIGKFFKHFPSLADAAIDASLDLCEDENVQIRRQAIKNLPQLCKETKEHVPRIADILAQLLIVDDSVELQQVHLSLETVMAIDPKGTFAGLVSIQLS